MSAAGEGAAGLSLGRRGLQAGAGGRTAPQAPGPPPLPEPGSSASRAGTAPGLPESLTHSAEWAEDSPQAMGGRVADPYRPEQADACGARALHNPSAVHPQGGGAAGAVREAGPLSAALQALFLLP